MTRLLLDSHVALWWLEGSESLGSDCRRLIETADVVHFSAVTPWELGIKSALGKLDMPGGMVAALLASDHTLRAYEVELIDAVR
jgi:PIN domain nuclease of toxin-antitoxin system